MTPRARQLRLSEARWRALLVGVAGLLAAARWLGGGDAPAAGAAGPWYVPVSVGDGEVAAVPMATPPPPAASLPGAWRTFANGDDVLALASQGTVLWAGTRSGGLVRWDTASGAYTQFLAPQSPLGGNTVRDLAVDGGGRLWIATSGGLSVLDEHGTADAADDTWRTYTREGTFGGLPSDDVRVVKVDGNTIWVGAVQEWDGTDGAWKYGGLGHLDTKGTPATSDDVWALVASVESTKRAAPDGTVRLGIVSDNVRDIQLAQNGGVWVSTTPQWKLERPANPDEPRKWLQVDGGLSHVNPGPDFAATDDVWTPYSCEAGLQDSEGHQLIACSMGDLARDAQGRIWAASGGLGVIAFPGDRAILTPGVMFRFERDAGLTSFVEAIQPGVEANTMWFGTRTAGVRALAHGTSLRDQSDDVWRGVSVEQGLARERVQALVVGSAVVWAGTGPADGVGGGVAKIDPAAGTVTAAFVTAAPAGKAPPSNFVTSIGVGEAGSRWEGQVIAGLGSRAQRLFGHGVAVLDTAQTPATADDTWTLWSTEGTDDNGTPPYTGLAGDNVRTLAVAGDNVWLGSSPAVWDMVAESFVDGGLAVTDGTRWRSRTRATTANGLADNAVSALAEACDGSMWIGTGSDWTDGKGASRLRTTDPFVTTGDAWNTYTFPELAANEVEAILPDCDNDKMWVGSRHDSERGNWSDGGLAVHAGTADTWQTYNAANGLESYSAGRIKGESLSLALGADGSLWSGAFGTRQLSEQALIETAPYWPATINRRTGDTWTATTFDGLGEFRSLQSGPDGRLWAAVTRGGLARESIDPENWRVDRFLVGLLTRTEADGWRSVDVRTGGVPANDISAVAVADDGTVWVASEGWGFARYRVQDAAPTPTPTVDAPSPTPTPSPTATATPSGTRTPTPSATAMTSRTPTVGTPGPRWDFLAFLPFVEQR